MPGRTAGREPIYMQVHEAIRRDIERGRFRVGARLPGSRSMAVTLGVSRTVVLMAYEQLEAEGYVQTQGGSGTYVSAAAIEAPSPIETEGNPSASLANIPFSRFARCLALPTQTPTEHEYCTADVIDLSLPRVRSDARSLKHWRQTVAKLVRRRSVPDYPVLEGAPPLRAAVARYLRMERGIVVDPQEVVIVSGTQQARDLIARVLLDEGAVAGVEDPCYWGVRHTYAASGARLALAVEHGPAGPRDLHQQLRARGLPRAAVGLHAGAGLAAREDPRRQVAGRPWLHVDATARAGRMHRGWPVPARHPAHQQPAGAAPPCLA